MPETIHCRICGKAIRVSSFADQMQKIRHRRKTAHPTAYKRSVRKAVATRKRSK